MSDSESFERARAAAMRLLSCRPRTELEVRARLRRRFAAGVVDSVVDALKAAGLVDDTAFASLWRDSRASLNPRSGSAIAHELVAKGVSREVAREAVTGIDDEETAYRAGLKAARRHSDADLSDFKRRLWGYLKRRGFSDSVTRRTVTQLWSELNESGDK